MKRNWYKNEVIAILFGNIFLLISIILNILYVQYIWIRFLLGISVPILLGSYLMAISFFVNSTQNNEIPLFGNKVKQGGKGKCKDLN